LKCKLPPVDSLSGLEGGLDIWRGQRQRAVSPIPSACVPVSHQCCSRCTQLEWPHVLNTEHPRVEHASSAQCIGMSSVRIHRALRAKASDTARRLDCEHGSLQTYDSQHRMTHTSRRHRRNGGVRKPMKCASCLSLVCDPRLALAWNHRASKEISERETKSHRVVCESRREEAVTTRVRNHSSSVRLTST